MPSPAVVLLTVVLVPLFFMTLGLLHARRRRATLEEYISARGSVGTAVGTATLVATAMGVWILFSPAETTTVFGIVALVGYALGSAAPIVAFIWIGSRLRRLMPEGHSLTEYVWHRFGGPMYGFTLGVMVFYMFVFLAAELTAIAQAVKEVADIPLVATAVVVGITTLTYTAYGGLRATIFTDSVQFLVVLPLLLLALIGGVVGLKGIGAVWDQTKDKAPELLSASHGLGWETGIALIIGILAANLFHQGYWQRVYACRDEATLRRAFWLSAVLVLPIVFIAGLFGVMAVGAGIAENPSTALFAVVQEVMPAWLVLGVLALAVALVMSSVDSLLNGLVSSFTSDLHRIQPQVGIGRLLWWARAATVVLAGLAMAVATQGYSVLYLFLIADLVAAAVVVPVFLGLYLRRYSGGVAITSAVVGLVAGALFFPTPDFTGWLDIPKAGSLMVSFMAAVVGSSLTAGGLTALATWRRSGEEYDFGRLQRLVQAITG